MNKGRIILRNCRDDDLINEILEQLDLSISSLSGDPEPEDLIVFFNGQASSLNSNYLFIEKEWSFYQIISRIVESYVKLHQDVINFSKPIIEGESKRVYSFNKKIAVVELKPTLYSFTYNRYGVVEGTDLIRLKLWRLFAMLLNTNVSNHLLGITPSGLIDQEVEKYIPKSYPFISNYLGEVSFAGKPFSLVKFAGQLPPIEIIWKNYLVGTMKHNLKAVDQYNSRLGVALRYEEKFPKDIIRFDWRNSLPDKDECIPDEFADFYIAVEVARKIARLASLMLNTMLQSKGYQLVDLCYFMNLEGNMIHSEISPDGMKIKKKIASFDKDLWREGKDGETIVRIWNKLYEDLVH